MAIISSNGSKNDFLAAVADVTREVNDCRKSIANLLSQQRFFIKSHCDFNHEALAKLTLVLSEASIHTLDHKTHTIEQGLPTKQLTTSPSKVFSTQQTKEFFQAFKFGVIYNTNEPSL